MATYPDQGSFGSWFQLHLPDHLPDLQLHDVPPDHPDEFQFLDNHSLLLDFDRYSRRSDFGRFGPDTAPFDLDSEECLGQLLLYNVFFLDQGTQVSCVEPIQYQSKQSLNVLNN